MENCQRATQKWISRQQLQVCYTTNASRLLAGTSGNICGRSSVWGSSWRAGRCTWLAGNHVSLLFVLPILSFLVGAGLSSYIAQRRSERRALNVGLVSILVGSAVVLIPGLFGQTTALMIGVATIYFLDWYLVFQPRQRGTFAPFPSRRYGRRDLRWYAEPRCRYCNTVGIVISPSSRSAATGLLDDYHVTYRDAWFTLG